MKKYFFISAVLGLAFASCGKDEDTAALPVKAVVSGEQSNVCPSETVSLVAVSSGAQSYVWYFNGIKIADATSGIYVTGASGTYSAAGVNRKGEGEVSDGFVVVIDVCQFRTIISGNAKNICPNNYTVLTASATSATSYVWYKNNIEIINAISADYYATESGTYCAVGMVGGVAREKSSPKVVTINDACPTLFIDKLVGEWDVREYTSYFDGSVSSVADNYTMTAVKLTETTLKLSNIMSRKIPVGKGSEVIVTVNNESQSITFPCTKLEPTWYPAVSELDTYIYIDDGTDVPPYGYGMSQTITEIYQFSDTMMIIPAVVFDYSIGTGEYFWYSYNVVGAKDNAVEAYGAYASLTVWSKIGFDAPSSVSAKQSVPYKYESVNINSISKVKSALSKRNDKINLRSLKKVKLTN